MNAKLKSMSERQSERAENVEMTPDLALRLLEGHENYRALNAERVNQYAEDMRKRNWKRNGEAITIDWFGKLVNGHHRLRACIQASTSFPTWVIYGVEPEAVFTYDSHRVRTIRDALAHLGYARADLLGAALPFVWTWEKSKMLSRDSLGHPSRLELLGCLTRHPLLPQYTHDSKGLHELGMSNALTSALRYILVKSSTEEIANQFLGELGIGEMLTQTNPVFQLRKRLQKDVAANTANLKKRPKLALISKAWNMWLAGQECTQLSWRSSGPGSEVFPKISTQEEVAAVEQSE